MRAANEGLRGGRGVGRAGARRGPAGRRAADRARSRSWTWRTAAGGSRCGRRSTASARTAMAATLDLDLGDIVGADGPVTRTRRGELCVAADRRDAAGEGAAPAAGQARRRPRPRDPVPPALPRPDVRPGRPGRVHHPLEGDRGGAPLPGRPRVRGGRDPDAPADLRRRRGAPVRDAPQRSSTATSTCGSPPSCTSSAASSAGSRRSTSWARTSATRASATSTTPSSRWSRPTRPTRTTGT